MKPSKNILVTGWATIEGYNLPLFDSISDSFKFFLVNISGCFV